MKPIQKWTPPLVAYHYEEAVSTTRKLPKVTVQGHFNSWPGIVHTPTELMLMEQRPTRLKATPDAISRLEQALEWMKWLTIQERKLIWRRAAKMRWKEICRDFNISESTAIRRWRRALAKISTQLNNKV